MSKKFGKTSRSSLLRTAGASAIATLILASPANAIVPNDNFTPNQIVDGEGGVNGVGMFFRNDGFVCSGTLINPRTVLFAAHCVNDRPESDYGPVIQSAFSFDVNALPGFQQWIRNGFGSFPDHFVYNINQIQYDPRSLADPAAFGFLEADIALATLDLPAGNIPTWALLFSPLPTPGEITNQDGTGYHVNITGYGRSGSGTTGASQGIDWRRRAAENMLGALTSFDERNQFLFGNPFGDLPQSLYRLDFDDPNKTNPFDFNLYKDEARIREATTAGGDSGGPLILDAANNSLSTENLQIGVLSGGSRFFGPQVFSSYGTESFYQPLYLYWDYIAANSPYRYVNAVAGNGNWEDANHWITALDPNFRIIDNNGAVVNGLPTTLGAGPEGGSPDFGEVCFDPEGANPGDGCQDLATGNGTPPARETGAPIVSGIGQANLPGNPSNPEASEFAAGGEVAASANIVEEVAISEAPAAPAADANVVAPVVASAAAPGARAGMILGAEHQAHNGNNMISGGENIALLGVELAEEAPHTGAELADNQAQDDGADLVEDEAQGPNGGAPEFTDTPNPGPTLVNGLPGASGFVPNNIDPTISADPNVQVDARYYDVTLNQAGTTTLSSTVEIDRLNLVGPAALNIASAGRLTSILDITQMGGLMTVDGTLASQSDYSLIAGMLTGNGTIDLQGRNQRVTLQAATEADGSANDFVAEADDNPAVFNQQFLVPYLTSVAGMIAPGTMGGIGSLDINGNLILASGNRLLIDIGASGQNDSIAVNAVTPPDPDPSTPENEAPITSYVTSGNVNLGGTVAFNTIAGFDSFTGGTYRLITSNRRTFDDNGVRIDDLSNPVRDANGDVTRDANGDIVYNKVANPMTGTFGNVSDISAILVTSAVYGTNFVDVVVRAQSFQNVIDSRNAVQVSYAGLLDRNRGNEALRQLFTFLDFTDAATIQSTFNSWAPTTESTVQSIARGALGNVSDFYQNRSSLADRSTNGGTIAVIGRPVQLAATSLGGFGVSASPAVLNDAALNAADSEVRSGGVNEDMAVYLAGGFVNGDAGAMPLRNPPAGSGGDDEFDGFFIAGGLEYYLDESSFIGFSGYYSDIDASVTLGNSAESRTIMGSIYGRTKTFADLVLDARLSIGSYNAKTLRTVALGTQMFNLTTDDDSLMYSSEVGLSKELDLLGAIIAPGIRGRAAKINFSNVNERGGGPALTIVRPEYNSVQGLAGVEFKSKPGKALQLRASMNYVHEFIDNPNRFGANFVGGAGLLAPFALVNQDRNWGEVGVGLRYNTGAVSFDLSADSTVGRSDVQSQVYSGAVTFRF